MKLKLGIALGLLALGRRRRECSVLESRNILIFGDDTFECLGILVPEQEVCTQLEVLSSMQSDKVDIVECCDDACDAIAADLPGFKVKLCGHFLIDIAEQFKRVLPSPTKFRILPLQERLWRKA